MKNIARRMLRGYYARKLRRKSQILSLSTNGPTLVLAPHPDDEAFGCGALLARRAAAGVTIAVAYLTDGEASHRGHPILSAKHIAGLRRQEAERAMSSIGIAPDRLRFCGAPDGRLNALSERERAACVERLRGIVAELVPAELLLPCRDDGSSEHEAAFALMSDALAGLPCARPRVLEFPLWSWWSPFLLARIAARKGAVWRQPAGLFAEQKRALLASYPSQTEPLPPLARAALPRHFSRAFDVRDEFFLEAPTT